MKFSRTLAATALLLAASMTQALTLAPYSAAALAEAQKAGEPVALHFHADWCTTCKAQDKALTELQADPSLKLTVLRVDYDKEVDLKQQLKVRSQSTLIVYRGATERARLAGETQPDKLKAALKTAL
ncbi:MAG: thioredoxin family protein [Rhizobacter sp.]